MGIKSGKLTMNMNLSVGVGSSSVASQLEGLVGPSEEEIKNIEQPKKKKRKAKVRNKQKVHLLDRTDSIFYGAFLRLQVFKEQGRDTVDYIPSQRNCYCDNCGEPVRVYFKETHSTDRELSEVLLSFLQRFDYVGKCECDYYTFGNVVTEVNTQPSLEETIEETSSQDIVDENIMSEEVIQEVAATECVDVVTEETQPVSFAERLQGFSNRANQMLQNLKEEENKKDYEQLTLFSD